MKDKADIDAALARLGTRLQELCSELPQDQVLKAFSDETAPVTEHVPPELESYVERRIHAMLAGAGLIQDDSPSG